MITFSEIFGKTYSSCDTCGALIDYDQKNVHTDWHEALVRSLEHIHAEAKRYKRPPRYG